MNVEQMKIVVRELISKTDLTPCIIGHRGVGKSAGIMQAAAEAGFRYTSVRLGQMEVGDLIGIPYRDGNVTHWSKPCWWPEDNDPPTLVHCDELNRAQQEDTLQAVFQFIEPPLEGRNRGLHTHLLARKHKVAVSINPPDGTYQVATLDRALLDRMILLNVISDHNCWLNYASLKSLDSDVRSFISLNRQLLSTSQEGLNVFAEPTERAWEMVCSVKSGCRLPAELELEVYAGIVGNEAAVALMRWLSDKSGRPVSAEEVLHEWVAVSARAASQRDDLQAATIADISAVCMNMKSFVEEEENNLISYISILPKDLKFAFIKRLLTIPAVAQILCNDKHDSVVLEALGKIGAQAFEDKIAEKVY